MTKNESTEVKKISKSNMTKESRTIGGVSFRSIFLGSLFVIISAWVGQYSRYYIIQADFDTMYVPSGQGLAVVLIISIMMLGITKVTKKIVKFSPGELGTIYIMVALSATLMGSGLVSYMVSTIPALTMQRMDLPVLIEDLGEYYGRTISSLVIIQDDVTALAYFVGLEGAGMERVPWGSWIIPVVIWTLFWLALYFVFMCLSALVHREWAVHQHLTYPVAAPVLDVIEFEKDKNTGIWQDNKFWIGVGIILIISLSKTINSYFPVIPAIPTFLALGEVFSEPPWDALGSWPEWGIRIHPMALGISFLLPLDMVFSLVFFGLITHIYPVVQSGMQWNWEYNYLYRFASHSAYFVIAGYQLWVIRNYMKDVFRKAFSMRDVAGHEDEDPLSSRMIAIGGLLSLIFILFFMVYLLPFKLLPAIVIILFGLIGAFTFARLRAQAGVFWMRGIPYWMDRTWVNLGSNFLGEQGRYGRAFITPLTIGTFGGQLANITDSYFIADGSGVSKRKISGVLIFTFIVAVLAGSYFTINAVHKEGLWLSGLDDFTVVATWTLNAATQPWYPRELVLGINAVAMLVGFITVIILIILRRVFIWWPLEPIGFAAAFQSEVVAYIWGSLLIVWLTKFVMYRYFGSGVVKKAQPFFMGMLIAYVIYRALLGFFGISTGEGW